MQLTLKHHGTKIRVHNFKVKVAQSFPTLPPHDYTVHGILQVRILEQGAFPFSTDLPNPGIEPRSPALQADSLPAEPQGKPKNTGVGSLSLLQGIFPTHELNWGLLRCRRILYQLSHQGSPVLLTSCDAEKNCMTYACGQCLSQVRLWDPVVCSLPGFPVHGLLQARIQEWVAISHCV